MDATAACANSWLRLFAREAAGSVSGCAGHDRSLTRNRRLAKDSSRIGSTSRTIDDNRAIDGNPTIDDDRAIDKNLINRYLATGSHEDFERLVDRYKDRVHRLVLSVMGPRLSAEAEDVAQDVFVQVYRKLATFRMHSSFSTWLYRIAYNKAVEYRRKARNRLPHCDVASLAGLSATDSHADPARAADDRQRRRRILQSVEGLGDPYRTVVYMHYWMNLTVSDIAAFLSTKTGTVKSHLHRARARLAQTLEREARDE